MAEELYMNKNGFKCVKGQLVKTDGIDPQLFERQEKAKREALQ